MKELAKFWCMIATYFGTTFDDIRLKMYAEDTKGLSIDDMKRAFGIYRKNPKNVKPPLPSQLISLLEPHSDPLLASKEVVATITLAVRKYGYTGAQEASEHMGEFATELVNSLGGWEYLCKNLGTTIPQSTFYAQARDLARARLEHSIKMENRQKISSKVRPELISQKEKE